MNYEISYCLNGKPIVKDVVYKNIRALKRQLKKLKADGTIDIWDHQATVYYNPRRK